VRVEGKDVQAIDAVHLRRRIGYVSRASGCSAHDGGGKHRHHAEAMGWDDARMAARVDTLLELVRLDRQSTATDFPRSFPAAKASASASPAPSRPSRGSC